MGDYIVGRYDSRIKVYYQGTWHPINRLRVFVNNSWRDFGDNEDSNTNELYVLDTNKESKRLTRDRVDTQKTEYVRSGYHQGEWNINTRQQYCFNNTGGATNTKFYAMFKVKASGASRLFYFASSYFWDTWFDSGINADGTIWYRVHDSGGKTWSGGSTQWSASDNTHVTNAAIQMGFDKDWQTIEFVGDIGTDTLYVKVNGVSQGFSRHTAWATDSKDGKVGSNNLRVATDNSFKINTANNPFTSISEDTTTRTYVETTWV